MDSNNPDGPKGKVTVDDVAQFLVNFEGGATGCFESTRLLPAGKTTTPLKLMVKRDLLSGILKIRIIFMFYDNDSITNGSRLPKDKCYA